MEPQIATLSILLMIFIATPISPAASGQRGLIDASLAFEFASEINNPALRLYSILEVERNDNDLMKALLRDRKRKRTKIVFIFQNTRKERGQLSYIAPSLHHFANCVE